MKPICSRQSIVFIGMILLLFNGNGLVQASDQSQRINGPNADFSISGTVRDQSGNPLSGVVISAVPVFSVVQVLDEAGIPVVGAEVWQNGVLVGTSAANGVLELQVTMGDRLVARQLIKTVPAIRSRHNQGAALNWAYHLYITSLAIPAGEEPAQAIVTNPIVTQTLTLRKDNTLIGFNIVVSVEWDANAEYLENLRQGFELASAALYDATNGQMLFERVTIFDNNQAMGSADYQIRASNTITPYVNAVGGLTSAPDKFITTGRYFVRSTLSDLGQWDLTGNYRTLLHEFGHYGLYLYDSYFQYNIYDHWRKIDADCTSPEIRTNQTPERNATLMDWGYNATEFSARGTGDLAVYGAWDPEYCMDTEHYRVTKESDWETIRKNYKSPWPPLWTLKTPIDYQQLLPGPNAIPLQEWSKVILDQDVQTGACEPAPVIQVVNLYGTPRSQVKVVLQRGNRLIEEGQTDRQGKISLLGAVPGDRATYEEPIFMLGALRGPDASNSSIATQIVSCASSRRSSESTEDSLVTLEPAAFKLEIKISPSANPQQAALQVQASTSLASEPQVTWMQTGASSIVTPTLSYDPLSQTYQGFIPLADGLPSEGELFVKAVDLQQHIVHTSRMVLLEEATPSEEQTIISSDGMAELFIPANSVQGSGQISLQEEPVAGEQPSGLEQLGGAYTIQPASGIIQTGLANLTLRYLYDGTSGNKINPNSLQIFSWDGQQWEPVTSTVSLNEQYASASVEISGTTFALFGSWMQQVYIPLIMNTFTGSFQTVENPPASADTVSSPIQARPFSTVQNQQFSPATPSSSPVFTATTDGTGIYTIAGLPPTVYSVGVVQAGLIYTPTSRTVNLYSNVENQDFTYIAPPGQGYGMTKPVPAGLFWMGCAPEDALCILRETPLHLVYLDSYFIDRWEVTNGRYKSCVAAGDCTQPDSDCLHQGCYPGDPNCGNYYTDPYYVAHPVQCVNWEQAQTFCQWEGRRLPTEAEWEKAARGSNDIRIYTWGNQLPACPLVGYRCDPDYIRLDYVGLFPLGASPYGVEDLAANSTEWVYDWYKADYYSYTTFSNPQGPTSGNERVIRSGTPFVRPNQNQMWRVSVRLFSPPQTYRGGFRCAASP